MIAFALTAWVAISFPAGLLIAACIPPSEDDRQHTLNQRGEGGKVRGIDQFHNEANSHD